MLAILELPDKTAHKGLSCFSSNKVASKQHQRRHQWRPPSRRLARTRDRRLAPYHGTSTAACACRAPPPRLRVPARPPSRAGPMESILYGSTDYTDYSSPKRHACTRIAAHTAARTPGARIERTGTQRRETPHPARS